MIPLFSVQNSSLLTLATRSVAAKKKKRRKVGITKDGAGTDVVIRDIKQSFFVTNITFEKV